MDRQLRGCHEFSFFCRQVTDRLKPKCYWDMIMKFFLMLIFLVTQTTVIAIADETVVPTLEQGGHRGDIARLAKEKAVARFDAADTNKDGKLSMLEVEKSFPYLAQNFDKTDVNKDGSISWEEYVGHNQWPK